MLDKTDNPLYLADLQLALANAANQVDDQGKRSALILKSLTTIKEKGKVIPILARTGGSEALATVLKEFENGDANLRNTCFKALTSWKDYSASSALFEICASGNKTFEEPAFDGYVKQIRSAPVPEDYVGSIHFGTVRAGTPRPAGGLVQ